MTRAVQVNKSTGGSRETLPVRDRLDVAGTNGSAKWLAILDREESAPGQWNAWCKHLAKRKRPVAINRLIASTGVHPLCWALPPAAPIQDAALWIEGGLGSRRSAKNWAQWAEGIESWLRTAESRPADPALALECLAWCHALPELSSTVEPDVWWRLLDFLIETAGESAGVDPAINPLAHQLLAGELPLTLAYVFPEITHCHALAKPASAALARGIDELLDGEGVPHCRNLVLLRPLLACWTRCRTMGRQIKKKLLPRLARVQYDWVPRQALRLTRPDGTQTLCEEGKPWQRPLLEAALSLVNDSEDWAAADNVCGGRKLKPSARRAASEPLPAMHSEWGESAVLLTDWSRRSPRLTVTFADRACLCELSNLGQVVWSGPWDPSVCIDGQTMSLQSDWEEVCWISDADADCLEIEADLGDGWQLQRQICLAREDRLLFMADVVLGSRAANIEYGCRLPVVDDISYRWGDATREVTLAGKRKLAVAMPLALPEWQAEESTGSLSASEDGLELKQRVDGVALYAPMFIDLHAKRFKKPLTWRRLTVAEKLEIQPPDVAVGYRVQLGRRQWLIYRSLSRRGNRSVLGQNISWEFQLGQFDAHGEVEPIVEIE